jgi:hypothetical protein
MLSFGIPNFSACCSAIPLMEQLVEVLKIDIISSCCSVWGLMEQQEEMNFISRLPHVVPLGI